MSDSVVIWRMCVVWDKARIAIIFGGMLLVSTAALNIANLAFRAGARPFSLNDGGVAQNYSDSEIILTYGSNYVGIAAALVSLASNLMATILVAFKIWYAIDYSIYEKFHSHCIGSTGGSYRSS